MGSSFGNSGIWINIKNTGAIERVFCIDHGQSAIGAITTRYAIGGNPLDRDRLNESDRSFISQRPDRLLRNFELHPAFQRCTFTIADSVHVQETIFVPLEDLAFDDPPAAFQMIELRNFREQDRELRLLAFARLRGSLPEDVIVSYDDSLNAFVAYNRSDPSTTRFFGLEHAPTAYATTFDYATAYDPSRSPKLDGSVAAQGDVLGVLQVDVRLAPGETCNFTFVAAAYAREIQPATTCYRALPKGGGALERTIEHLESVLSRGRLLCPDSALNDGSLWSKVNMRRVMARYPQGPAFTNDPGNTSNFVFRDAAWFVYGNDHFLPTFSRLLLDKMVELQYPSGKLPEYFDAITGRIEDNGLNINDDTPLFILAINHHYRSTGDQQWLESVYNGVARAADYIISQCDDRGLVFCNARDPRGGVWSIASWRNIIPGYSINGAVTEVNAECVAALRAAGHLASETGHEEDRQRFSVHSTIVRNAMDRHLINPETGLFYLNIDVDGNKHSDVTGDQIFPVMFRACDEEVGYRVISRLNMPDFSTPAGLRTASRDDPRYDPAAYAGLVGGVWPGLTWWYSFAAAKYHPDAMVRSLRSSFQHYASDPRKNNTLPGQFSEWFDGESLTNKGMRLSPWEPPRFLWASVEGVCGMMLTTGAPRITPLIPKSWKWVALSNLPYHGGTLSYILTREGDALRTYSTLDVDCGWSKELFEEDVSHRMTTLSETAPFMALRRAHDFLILVGNSEAKTVSVAFDLHGLLELDSEYSFRVYSSEQGVWEQDHRSMSRGNLDSLGVSIETQGFRLIDLRRI